MKKLYLYSLIILVTFYSCVQVVSSKNNKPPIAKFSVNNKIGTTETQFIFDGSFSSDDLDDILQLKYFWEYYSNYGKLIDSAFGIVDTASFLDTGRYFINLTVFDADSLFDTYEDTILVKQYKTAILSAIDTCINFGPVECDFTISRRLSIQNLGSDTLMVSAIYFTGEGKTAFSSNFESQVNILPDSAKNVIIHFTPHEIGDYSSEINILSNDSNNPEKKICLSGQGFEDLYDIEFTNIESDTINFEKIELGADSTFNIILKNTGTENREILAAYIIGEGRNSFKCNFSSEFIIESGKERGIEIIFSPQDTVDFLATLIIKSDDPFSEKKEIYLKGSGYKNIPILNFPNIDMNTVDFGNVEVSRSLSVPLQLLNQGDAELTISAIYITGEKRQNFDCDFVNEFSLNPKESHVINLDFLPDENITYNATLKIMSNDGYYTTKEINLTGKGTQSELEIISPSGNLLDFGNIEVDKDTTIFVEVQNKGDGVVQIIDAYIMKENISAFTCDFVSETSLDPGEKETIGITFSPMEINDFSAEFVIKTDEVISNKKSLSIIGKSYKNLYMIVDKDSLDFGDVIIDNDSTQYLNVYNNGNRQLTIYYSYFEGNNKELYTSDFASEMVIDPEETIQLGITFSPVDANYIGDNYFYFFSDDPESQLKKIHLSGQGILPAEVECLDSIDFGNVKMNQSKTEILKINNIGQVPFVNLELVLDSDDFTFQIENPIDIMAGNSLDASIIFAPTSFVGVKSAKLIIKTENYGKIKEIQLNGVATTP